MCMQLTKKLTPQNLYKMYRVVIANGLIVTKDQFLKWLRILSLFCRCFLYRGLYFYGLDDEQLRVSYQKRVLLTCHAHLGSPSLFVGCSSIQLSVVFFNQLVFFICLVPNVICVPGLFIRDLSVLCPMLFVSLDCSFVISLSCAQCYLCPWIVHS